jgi:putative transposase
MTRLDDRQTLMRDIALACDEGVRLAPACGVAGIAARTLPRWKIDGLARGDRRPDANRPVPLHALSEAERTRIIVLAKEPCFAATPRARIIPALADEGLCIASGESRFHRVLRAHGQMNRRSRARARRTSGPPRTHIAGRPGEVRCWDVTLLPAQAQGRWFDFYPLLDLYSRKVGFEVHDTDNAEHATHWARSPR